MLLQTGPPAPFQVTLTANVLLPKAQGGAAQVDEGLPQAWSRQGVNDQWGADGLSALQDLSDYWEGWQKAEHRGQPVGVRSRKPAWRKRRLSWDELFQGGVGQPGQGS